MIKDLWINLPVKNLAQSTTFYKGLGFAPNPGPGNSENSASFFVGEKKIVLMLFTEAAFAGFANNVVSDASKGTEVLFSVGMESREKVDDIARRAAASGGRVFHAPGESGGFMYGCGIVDPDGHRWNALYMDISARPKSL